MIRTEHKRACSVELSLDELPGVLRGEYTHRVNAEVFECLFGSLDTRMPSEASWFGGLRSPAAATALITDGWRDGASRLESLASEVSAPAARSRRRRLTWRDEGDDLNVDRALVGSWDNAWRTSRREWVAGPQHVTVYASIGGNSDRNSEELFWAGATALVVCDRLEQAGYAVRLVATLVAHASASDTPYRIDLLVKDSDEPLRVDALASLTAHAGVFRTFGLASTCILPCYVGTGLGRQAPWSENEDAYRAAGLWQEDAVRLEAAHTRVECLTEIKRALASIGGEP